MQGEGSGVTCAGVRGRGGALTVLLHVVRCPGSEAMQSLGCQLSQRAGRAETGSAAGTPPHGSCTCPSGPVYSARGGLPEAVCIRHTVQREHCRDDTCARIFELSTCTCTCIFL